MEFKDKTIVVTVGTQGIGKCIAECFVPQRDDLIEEIKRTDLLLEWAVQHGDEAEAERLREKLRNLIIFSQGKSRGSESEKPGGEPAGAGQTQRPRRSVPPGPVRLTSSRPDRSRLGCLSRPTSPVHRANVHCEPLSVAHSPIEQHCKGGGL